MQKEILDNYKIKYEYILVDNMSKQNINLM